MGRAEVLGFTIGDAAGVGPELILRSAGALDAQGPWVVFGSAAVLRAAREDLVQRHGLALPQIEEVRAAEQARGMRGRIALLESAPVPPGLVLDPYPWGHAIAFFGTLQHAALHAAVDACLAGNIAAVVTTPWHKARLRDAGLPPTGHTEVLEERAGRGGVMMLSGARLRVALVTAHLPLREVADALCAEAIVARAEIVLEALQRDFGIPEPTLAVCGLNPHAGEAGVLGGEEEQVIAPALDTLRERWAGRARITGPWPADTLFPRVVHGVEPADAVLAMYHDQGLVPLKTVHFGESANITLGLPFVRSSVDHGTAYDIAGEGVASESSLLYAAAEARRMVAARGRQKA